MIKQRRFYIARVAAGLEQAICTLLSPWNVHQCAVLSHRSLVFESDTPITELVKIPYFDDLFFHLGSFQGLSHTKASLEDLQQQLADMQVLESSADLFEPSHALQSYSLTASFLGKRNYSRWNIADVACAAIDPDSKFTFRDPRQELDDHVDLHFRIHLYEDTGFLGLRVSKQPLYKRNYKDIHREGSLAAPIAAYMLTFCPDYAATILDPMAGCGTFLCEAALQFDKAQILGIDSDAEALRAMQKNCMSFSQITCIQADTQKLPLLDSSISCITCDLPWGIQTSLSHAGELRYQPLLTEWERVLHPEGRALLLTERQDLLEEALNTTSFQSLHRQSLSLYGRHPEFYCLQVPSL